MKTISSRAITLLLTVAVAIGSFVFTTSANAASKYFTVSGQVLKKDKKARTLLVKDTRSAKQYLIKVPEGATFRITFGRYMRMGEPGINEVDTHDRVSIRCLRPNNEHIASLENGTEVVLLTASR